MGILINAYCTHRHPPELDFQHQLNARRDRSDPELVDHLNGFIGFVLGGGQREMTQSLYHIVRHLQRVRHHVSLTVEREHLAEFQRWAQEANAVLFLGDSTVRDPRGKVLVDPATGEPHEGATVPYPADALARRERSGEMLQQMGAPEPTALPPVAGEDEAELRDPVEVAHRALALIVAAVYGESLATDDAIPVEAFKDRNPIGVAFQAADNGKMATYFARWANSKGDTGPWSVPFTFGIAA